MMLHKEAHGWLGLADHKPNDPKPYDREGTTSSYFWHRHHEGIERRASTTNKAHIKQGTQFSQTWFVSEYIQGHTQTGALANWRLLTDALVIE